MLTIQFSHLYPNGYTDTSLHKAIGPDQLPNWILKDMAGIIGVPMWYLFSSSLRDSYIPILWKSANICQLPKTKPI